ncbi:hypothetical protein MUG78_00445 [Gordonia alkaliphila]|uniref:hypothetical protein n=1 Tax=Gordonia alkaliphila TaxID=1053547 RepID=UPI001FF4DFCE|nr:hypothetical protein [Gordonia alkaliphila]MCK0437967.1 hypothetical protein [Gordonia alkaliphila]
MVDVRDDAEVPDPGRIGERLVGEGGNGNCSLGRRFVVILSRELSDPDQRQQRTGRAALDAAPMEVWAPIG